MLILSTVMNHAKRLLLISLLLSIFIAAHPWGVYEKAANTIWSLLVPLGLDIAMTPVTSDMQLMYDKGSSVNGNLKQISVVTGWDHQVRKKSLADLNFHRFKIPFLLMSERFENHPSDLDLYIYALCSELEKIYSQAPNWFLIEIENATPKDKLKGFHQVFSCSALKRPT